MPTLLRAILFAALLLTSSIAHPDTIQFSDITRWTGTGNSRAALFIDWQDGKDPIVRGYRFDAGSFVTGATMLRDVVTADGDLYARIESFGFGDAAIGLGVDRDADGFTVTGSDNAPVFDANGFATGTGDNGLPADSDDSYAEAWNSGFWSYHNAALADGAWSEATAGMGDRLLGDGDSDGWSFAFGFPFPAPGPGLGPVTAVPEPSGGFAIIAALAATMLRRRHFRPTVPPVESTTTRPEFRVTCESSICLG